MFSLRTVAVLIIMLLVSWGVASVYAIPDTALDSLKLIEERGGTPSTDYQWRSYNDDTCEWTDYHVSVEITSDDFASSMNRNLLRCSSLLVPAPYNFIEPDNPYVQEIAQYILDNTEGFSDRNLATVCLDFVQECIIYTHDPLMFGFTEFWTLPTETLYLHSGDCEDKAILLVSLLEAVGLGSVLLDYDGHMAVGVELSDGEGFAYAQNDRVYYFCETTSDLPIGNSGHKDGTEEVILWSADSGNVLGEIINSGLVGYRHLIQRVFST
ncbi:MAG: hypothetical protein E7Z67_04825 [Thermoplasmata archaeon]|nr:hypothetical protein [Thermoplasmata archaeon]